MFNAPVKFRGILLTFERAEMKTDRIYAVKNTATKDTRLIEAASKSAALSFAVKTTLTVELAGQSEIYELASAGVKVEKADAPAPSSE